MKRKKQQEEKAMREYQEQRKRYKFLQELYFKIHGGENTYEEWKMYQRYLKEYEADPPIYPRPHMEEPEEIQIP